MPWRSQSEPTTTERIIASLSYLTLGITGLLYMVFSKRRDLSTQFRFHTFQSIFLSILAALINFGSTPLFTLLANFVSLVSPAAANMIMHAGMTVDQIVSLVFGCVLLYGAIMAFLGKFTKIPFVSDLIHRNMPAG